MVSRRSALASKVILSSPLMEITMGVVQRVSIAFFLASVPLLSSAAPDISASTAALDEPVREYAATCMAHFFSKSDLHPRLDNDRGAMKYTPEQAAPFLRGQSGEAWGVHGRTNNYVVALVGSHICSVNVERPSENTERDFKHLLELLFPGTELVPVEQALAGPSSELVHSAGFQLKSRGRLLPPIFTIVSSKDPALHFSYLLTLWFPEGG